MAKSGRQSTFEDHLAYTDAMRRPILLELRRHTLALDRRIRETVTPGNRIAYSLERVFVEVKVQKSKLRLHFVNGVFRDPERRIKEIPKSHGWGDLKNLFEVETPEDMAYAIPIIEAAYKSLKP